MRPYAERKAARIERLRHRAATRASEATSAFKRVDQIASVIPMGQPILIGHHSEGRHRRDLARIDNGMRKGIEASKEAAELLRRADAAEENTAISSDDPEAVDRLKEKLADLERLRLRYKEINTTIRTAQRHAKKDGVPWEPVAVKALVDMGVPTGDAYGYVKPDFAGRIGIANYQLTNLGGNIRRVQQRITQLEAQAARATPEPETYGAIKIEESENRVRVYFADKPSAEVRTLLKSWGFRWAPTEGAWQRMASPAAWHWARDIAKKVSGASAPAVDTNTQGETNENEDTAP